MSYWANRQKQLNQAAEKEESKLNNINKKINFLGITPQTPVYSAQAPQ